MDYSITFHPIEILCLLPGLAAIIFLARNYRVVKLQKRILQVEEQLLDAHQEILILEKEKTRLTANAIEPSLAKSA